jgi:hypothetical protein
MKALLVIGFAAVAMTAPPAVAAGNDQSGFTVGDCISDGFLGNEPNIVDPFAPGGPAEQEPGAAAGRVTPSQSPGPFVTNPDGSVRRGASPGDVSQTFGAGTVPEICRALAG